MVIYYALMDIYVKNVISILKDTLLALFFLSE